MRNLLLITIMLLVHLLNAQPSEIELLETRSDGKIELFAQNNSEEALEITLSAELTGFITTDKNPLKQTILPKTKSLVMTLVAPPGVACQYSTSVTYTKAKKVTTNRDLTKKENSSSDKINLTKINVFTQDGCGRCDYVVKYLQDKKIPFVELNTTTLPSNQGLMFESLQEAGFTGNSVQMPVVINKGKAEYNIKDLPTWVKSIK